MHLHDLMGWRGPMTERQYRAWQAWLLMELDVPSRADWYAMQVAQYSCSKARPLSAFKIPFKTGPNMKPSDEEQAAQVAEAKRRAKIRGGGNVIKLTPEQAEAEMERRRADIASKPPRKHVTTRRKR